MMKKTITLIIYNISFLALSQDLTLNSNYSLLGNNGSGTYTQLIFWNGSNSYYGRNATGASVSNHYFRTNGLDRMIIKDNGNIGIGTTNPSDKLHIYDGNVRQTIVGTPSEWVYLIQSSGQNSGIWTNGGNPALYLRNTAGNLNTVIRPDGNSYLNGGNVGIGTTNPNTKFHIEGTSSTYSRIANSSGDTRLTFGAVNGRNIIYSQTYSGLAQTLKLQVNNEDNFVIKTNGSIGIGYSNPSEKLDVNGNIKVNRAVKIDGSGSVASLQIMDNSNTSTADILLRGDGGDSYINATNGQLGIGTRNPDAMLAVKGTVHAEEVKVDLNVPGPDYVFESDYSLSSLEEVEKYIKANKHLSDIPSAKQMKEEGIKIGEMNMKLLQKIEELTLYLIEQNKEIKTLKAEIQELKAE